MFPCLQCCGICFSQSLPSLPGTCLTRRFHNLGFSHRWSPHPPQSHRSARSATIPARDGPRTSGATPTTSEAGLRGIVGPEPETTTPSRHGLPPQWLYPRLPVRWNEIVPEDGETLELKMPEIQRDRDQPSVRNKKIPPMMALPDPPCVSNHRLGHLLSLDARRHRRRRCANTALGTNNPPTWSGP